MKKQKNQPKVDQKSEQKSGNTWWMVIGAVILFGGIAWFSLRNSDTPAPIPSGQPVLATLSPSMFIGQTREAYQIAKDLPDVLQQLPCFCGCKEGFGHASNYFCFTDQHGAECNMCQDIALDAKKMHDSGMSTAKIRDAIRDKYGKGTSSSN